MQFQDFDYPAQAAQKSKSNPVEAGKQGQAAPAPRKVSSLAQSASTKGERGMRGDKGDKGLKGDKGDVGLKGDKGDVGPRGETPMHSSNYTVYAKVAADTSQTVATLFETIDDLDQITILAQGSGKCSLSLGGVVLHQISIDSPDQYAPFPVVLQKNGIKSASPIEVNVTCGNDDTLTVVLIQTISSKN